MRAFFRSVFLADPGVDAPLADRLADACVKRINRMLVWDATGTDSAQPAEAASAVPVPVSPTHAGSTAAVEVTAPPAFDPFAFSVVVMLKRNGRAALADALKEIAVADLRKLAEAQHLGVDPAIKDAKKLREAIIKGAEQRMADRKAAAS